MNRFRFTSLSDQFFVCEALADDFTYTNIEPFRVSHLAIIEPKRLLVDVAKQMEGFHADIGAVQLPLHQRPEVFHTVSVDIAIGILDGVIDDRVLVVFAQSIIGEQFIGEDCRASFDMFTDLALQFGLATIRYMPSREHFRSRVRACQERFPYSYRQFQ